jgi:hypothetical protein
MARKPNYKFERKERDRVKAAKKAERLAAKEEARKRKTEQPETDGDVGDRTATESSN